MNSSARILATAFAAVGLVQASTAAPVVTSTQTPEPLGFIPGSWTIVVLPDTQYYTVAYPEIFDSQTQWIVQNKDERNIVYVLHLGDIVHNNTPMQWTRARRSMKILDGHVPYALVPGNHDYGDDGSANNRGSYFNDYFPYSAYSGWPTFGGAMQAGKMDNTYHLFAAGARDWLVLALEWGPRNSVVEWANRVVEENRGRSVILITHAYLYFDDSRYDWNQKGNAQLWSPYSYGTASDADGTNDGEDLWQKLVRKHPEFVMTFNGHVLDDGLGRLSSPGDHGNIVHQMLVNYQMHAMGGEGYLRLLEFLPDGQTVFVKAYSPYRDRYKTDRQNQFTLHLGPEPPGLPDPIELRITKVWKSADQIHFQVANSTGRAFDVESSSNLESGTWETVASGQIETELSLPISVMRTLFWRLRQTSEP